MELGAFRVRQLTGDVSFGSNCDICLEDFADVESLVSLFDCKHVFCSPCSKKQKFKNCPKCRNGNQMTNPHPPVLESLLTNKLPPDLKQSLEQVGQIPTPIIFIGTYGVGKSALISHTFDVKVKSAHSDLAKRGDYEEPSSSPFRGTTEVKTYPSQSFCVYEIPGEKYGLDMKIDSLIPNLPLQPWIVVLMVSAQSRVLQHFAQILEKDMLNWPKGSKLILRVRTSDEKLFEQIIKDFKSDEKLGALFSVSGLEIKKEEKVYTLYKSPKPKSSVPEKKKSPSDINLQKENLKAKPEIDAESIIGFICFGEVDHKTKNYIGSQSFSFCVLISLLLSKQKNVDLKIKEFHISQYMKDLPSKLSSLTPEFINRIRDLNLSDPDSQLLHYIVCTSSVFLAGCILNYLKHIHTTNASEYSGITFHTLPPS